VYRNYTIYFERGPETNQNDFQLKIFKYDDTTVFIEFKKKSGDDVAFKQRVNFFLNDVIPGMIELDDEFEFEEND